MGNAQARSVALVGGMKRNAALAELRRQKHAEYMKRQRMMCAICHEPIEEGQSTLTCHKNSDRPHVFHEECLHGWLRMNNHNNNRCPTCNLPCMATEEYLQRYPVLAPQAQTNDTLVNEHAFDYTEDELEVNEDLYDFYVTYWADMHPNAAAQGWGWKKIECPVCEKFQWFLTNQEFDDDFRQEGWVREDGNLACEACWQYAITLECVMCGKKETLFEVDEANVFEVATDFTKLPFPDAALCNQCNLTDKKQVIDALNNGKRILEYATTLQNDRDVVMVAVKQSGYSLEYASSTLRSDKTVVEAALMKSGHALEYASNELQGDSNMVHVAIDNTKYHGKILHNYFTHTKDNRDIQKTVVLHAVGLNGLSLRHVVEPLKNDIDVVRKAIDENYKALRFVPTQVLRDNTDLIWRALRNVKSGDVAEIFQIPVVQQVVREDKPLLLKALTVVAPHTLFDWGRNIGKYGWGDDKEVMLVLVNQEPTFLESASERLKADEDVVTAAIKINANVLLYASKDIKGSKTFALAAMEYARSQSSTHPRYIILMEYKENTKDTPQDQREVLLQALPYYIEGRPREVDLLQSLKLTVKEAKAMIQINPITYQYLEEDLQAHQEVFDAAYNHENIEEEDKSETKRIMDRLHEVNQSEDDSDNKPDEYDEDDPYYNQENPHLFQWSLTKKQWVENPDGNKYSWDDEKDDWVLDQ